MKVLVITGRNHPCNVTIILPIKGCSSVNLKLNAACNYKVTNITKYCDLATLKEV